MKKIVKIEPAPGERYFAAGNLVRMHPITTHYEDGTQGMAMGFIICTISNGVVEPEAAAAEIARLLNEDQIAQANKSELAGSDV